LKKEIENLHSKVVLLNLRKEAILKVIEFNTFIENVNEKVPMKPIILALYYNDSAPMFLGKNDADLYDKDIKLIKENITKLTKELEILVNSKKFAEKE